MMTRALPSGWWGVVPTLTLLAVFVAYPLWQVLQISTLRWDGVAPGQGIGLENYRNLLSDADLGRSLITTFTLAAAVIPLFVGLAAIIAIELDGTRFERVIKAILFLPGLWTIGASAIGWYTLYAPDYGLLATITNGVVAIPWRDQPWAALVLVGAFTIWLHLGYAVLVVSAGLKGIPTETLEAARVDGATESQVRWRVVIPLLRPSLVFLAVIGTLYSLQSYTAVFLLTQGGPFGSTRVLGYYLYETAFERFQYGYGAALSIGVLLVAFTFAALQARALRGSDQ
jgi:multiple sugar transport system permease protein